MSTILNNIVQPESGVTMVNNIVDNYEQRGSTTLFKSCFTSLKRVIICRRVTLSPSQCEHSLTTSPPFNHFLAAPLIWQNDYLFSAFKHQHLSSGLNRLYHYIYFFCMDSWILSLIFINPVRFAPVDRNMTSNKLSFPSIFLCILKPLYILYSYIVGDD